MTANDRLLVNQAFAGVILILRRNKPLTTEEAKSIEADFNRMADAQSVDITVKLNADPPIVPPG